MKYVVLKDKETGEIEKLGRFRGKAITEIFTPKGEWKIDNTLESDLFDGLLEEISEAKADQIIASRFRLEKQAA